MTGIYQAHRNRGQARADRVYFAASPRPVTARTCAASSEGFCMASRIRAFSIVTILRIDAFTASFLGFPFSTTPV